MCQEVVSSWEENAVVYLLTFWKGSQKFTEVTIAGYPSLFDQWCLKRLVVVDFWSKFIHKNSMSLPSTMGTQVAFMFRGYNL